MLSAFVGRNPKNNLMHIDLRLEDVTYGVSDFPHVDGLVEMRGAEAMHSRNLNRTPQPNPALLQTAFCQGDV